MFKRPVSWLTALCLILIAAMGASALTLTLAGARPTETAAMKRPLARAEEILEIVERDYYTEVDEDALVTGAIKGLLSALDDPYTFYYTPEAYQAMTQETTGLYNGVGMLIGLDGKGNVAVMRVFRDSPAERAGARAGDIIVSVSGAMVSGKTAQDLTAATKLLRGDGETPVNVDISRNGERFTLTLARGDVSINYVEYSIFEGNIGYLSIFQFTGDDVTGVEEALSAFRQANVSALIVDVRSNPGGLLSDVVSICDLLIPEGLIVYTEDRQGRRTEYFADADYWDVPLAVLVNGMSASASEIFAAAVQDTGRGLVIGENTYGKGIVQTLHAFSEGDGMQLTTSAYYTPAGKSIHGTGVTPDIAVSPDPGQTITYYAPDPAADAQLRAAIDALRE